MKGYAVLPYSGRREFVLQKLWNTLGPGGISGQEITAGEQGFIRIGVEGQLIDVEAIIVELMKKGLLAVCIDLDAELDNGNLIETIFLFLRQLGNEN